MKFFVYSKKGKGNQKVLSKCKTLKNISLSSYYTGTTSGSPYRYYYHSSLLDTTNSYSVAAATILLFVK